MAIKTKALKRHKNKLEPLKDTLVKTTGLEFDFIAMNDSDIEEKLMKYVDKHDPENPSEEFKVSSIIKSCTYL